MRLNCGQNMGHPFQGADGQAFIHGQYLDAGTVNSPISLPEITLDFTKQNKIQSDSYSIKLSPFDTATNSFVLQQSS